MRHESFNTHLHEVLDRRERPEDDAQLRALAEESVECRDALAAQQRLFEGLEADELPELPSGFAERVVASATLPPAAVKTAPAPRAGGWRHSWIFELAAVAAAVLLALGGWSLRTPSNNPPPEATAKATDSVAAEERAPLVAHEESPPPVGDPSLAAHQAERKQRYDELYQAIVERLPRSGDSQELLALRPQWVDEVALGLRPVATSLGGAINTLRSTLPSSSKSDPEEKPQARVFHAADVANIA